VNFLHGVGYEEVFYFYTNLHRANAFTLISSRPWPFHTSQPPANTECPISNHPNLVGGPVEKMSFFEIAL
jgi:hypothetical protein